MFLKVLTVVALVGFASASVLRVDEDLARNDPRCSIFVNSHLGDPQPLLITPGTNQFALPNTAAGIVRVAFNEQIELYCSTGFNNPSAGNFIYPTCINETRFMWNGAEHLFSEINCHLLPEHNAIRTGETCHGGATLAAVGFPVGGNFIRIFESCHDEQGAKNLWVHFVLQPGNQGFQRSFPRISFIQGDFYPGLPVNTLYTIVRQRATISSILGSTELGLQYVHTSGDIFMARGHMAARADFIFGVHMQASFYFINAAPQWQSFNGGNWEHIEDGVRQFVADRGIEVDVWTGTYGVMTLPDINGVQKEIYLDFDANGNGLIPVPKIYYKVVIQSSEAAGIVFIGVNNPHASLAQIQQEYIFCDDVSERVEYVPWDKRNITGGYSYACEVNEFAQFVGHLPTLPRVATLLL